MLLHPDEIKKSISTHGWNFSDNKISKIFEFDSYLDGVEFINKIAPIAERLNHHPDINIGGGYAKNSITTHAIEGLSENDFILAAKIDLLTNV